MTGDMVAEVRYVGNRNERAWTEENWNGENIFENGWLDEFTTAMHNLRANVDAGRCRTRATPNTIFQTTTVYTDINETHDPGGRLGQIVWRINW